MISQINCPPTDWRFPHVLAAYNAAVRRIAISLNVSYLDLWQSSLDVLELSEDGTHYGCSKDMLVSQACSGSPVGDAHAEMILQWLLAEGKWGRL